MNYLKRFFIIPFLCLFFVVGCQLHPTWLHFYSRSTFSLQGRVRSEEGIDIPGAQIKILPAKDAAKEAMIKTIAPVRPGPESYYSDITDENGVYNVENLPKGQYTVYVYKNDDPIGILTKLYAGPETEETFYETHAGPPGSISGFFISSADGQGKNGIPLYLDGTDFYAVTKNDPVTGKPGYCEFTDIPIGSYTIKPLCDDGSKWELNDVTAEVTSGANTQLPPSRITFHENRPYRAIEGNIYDLTEKPARNVSVAAWLSYPNFYGESPEIILGCADESGKYALPVNINGKYTVSLACMDENDIVTHTGDTEVETSYSLKGPDFTINSGHVIKGRISNVLGEPVSGLNLVFTATDSNGNIKQYKTVTDANGVYKFYTKEEYREGLTYTISLLNNNVDSISPNSLTVTANDSDTQNITLKYAGPTLEGGCSLTYEEGAVNKEITETANTNIPCLKDITVSITFNNPIKINPDQNKILLEEIGQTPVFLTAAAVDPVPGENTAKTFVAVISPQKLKSFTQYRVSIPGSGYGFNDSKYFCDRFGSSFSAGTSGKKDISTFTTGSDFSGGLGTLADPYIITTPKQLYLVGQSLYYDKHFKLGKDIDASKLIPDQQYYWKEFTGSLTGIYTGVQYKITDLPKTLCENMAGTINDVIFDRNQALPIFTNVIGTGTDSIEDVAVGSVTVNISWNGGKTLSNKSVLAGAVKGCTVNNAFVNASNISVSLSNEKEYFSLLAGEVGSDGDTSISKLKNCKISGDLVYTDSHTEYLDSSAVGLAFKNYGTIENCVNKCNISGTWQEINGICSLNKGKIDKCVNYGTFSAKGTKASINGICYTNNNLLSDCKNLGNISGNCSDKTTVNGICHTSENGNLINCVNEGNLSVYGNPAGAFGICSNIYGTGKVKDCKNNGNVTGNVTGNVSGSAEPSAVCGSSFYLDFDSELINFVNNGILTGGDKFLVNGVCVNSGGKITDCKNIGKIVSGSESYGNGIVHNNLGTLSGCVNSGLITSGDNSLVSGICDDNYYSEPGSSGSHTQGIITSCINNGDFIVGNGSHVFGICIFTGTVSGNIENCQNNGQKITDTGRENVPDWL